METAELSEEIIREQKRKIEQLQRQLLRSQLQLQQQTTFQPQQSLNAKANLAAFLQQQQINQQLLMLQQQQQQPQLIGFISNNNNNNNNINNNNTSNKQQPVLLNQINLKTANNQRTSSLPNFVGTFVQTVPAAPSVVEVPQVQVQVKEEKPAPTPAPAHNQDLHLQLPLLYHVKDEKTDLHLLPQLYNDSKLRVKPELDDMKGVKSQIVDDVLDILIKNGELPPSAAQDPSYPPGLDLRELGLDMEGDVEGMDLVDTLPPSELMDVDTDWLESLIDQPISSPSTSHDALLPQDPFDLFNIDDAGDFKMADFGWDRVDFAT